MEYSKIAFAISLMISGSAAFAADTSIKGNISTDLDIKSVTTADTGTNNTAEFNAGGVKNATIGGDFSTKVTTEIVQTSDGDNGANIVNMGTIDGYRISKDAKTRVQTGVITQINNGSNNNNEVTLGSAINRNSVSKINGSFDSNVKLNSVTQANYFNNASNNRLIAGSAINSSVGGDFRARVNVNGDISQGSTDSERYGRGSGNNLLTMSAATNNVSGAFDSRVNVGGDITQSYQGSHTNHANLGSVESSLNGSFRSRVSVAEGITQSGKTDNEAVLGGVTASFNGSVNTAVNVRSLTQSKKGYFAYGYNGNTFVAGSVYGDAVNGGNAENIRATNVTARVRTGAVTQSGTGRMGASAVARLASLGGKTGGRFYSSVTTGDITQDANFGTSRGKVQLNVGGIESGSENTGNFTAIVKTGNITQSRGNTIDIANMGGNSRNDGDFYARVNAGDITQTAGLRSGAPMIKLASMDNSTTRGFRSIVTIGDVTQTNNSAAYPKLRVGSVDNSHLGGAFDANATVGNVTQVSNAFATNEINIASVANTDLNGGFRTRVKVGDITQVVDTRNDNMVTNIGSVVNGEVSGY